VLLGDRALVDAVLDDHLNAPISDQYKTLFTFIERMNRESYSLQMEDVDRARAAGLSDEALYDAITVCALFNFYNKWIDATGVSDMPSAEYAATGERLTSRGYGGLPP
jgi:hypothetical protein